MNFWLFRSVLFLAAAWAGAPFVSGAVALDGAKDVYLSLEHAVSSQCGWGTAHDNASVTGSDLRIGSTAFDQGIGTHAPAEVVFRPGGKYRWLTFYAGISADMVENGAVTVQVWLDGKMVHETPLLRIKEEPRYVCLPLAEAKELRLVGTDGGNGTGADHINLCNLRLSVSEAEPKPEPLRKSAGASAALTPAANPGPLLPLHGTVSLAPAKKWEDSLATGNGIMGALLAGDPTQDTLIVNHCKLWLPLGSREIVPDVGTVLPEMRRIIGEKDYGAGHAFFLDQARKQGWDGKLVWTDPFHPGFIIKLDQTLAGDITEYARVEDFSTGEVWAQWRTPDGGFARRMFVSRADNIIAVLFTGPKGKVSARLRMDKIGNKLIESTITHTERLIATHNTYINGKGGYDGAVRIIPEGGSLSCDGQSVRIADADRLTVLLRLQPWKTPLTNSEAWPYSPDNPDFKNGNQSAPHSQKAALVYQPQWMDELKRDLAALPTDYDQLLAPHAKAHGAIFNRVSLDLGASGSERSLSSEALLDLAQKEKRLPAALLERMFDAGRYVFLCAAGPDTPPNLFGIWTGTWQPAWSGDYTLDTNIQLDIESAFSGNMAESMAGYFRLLESFAPDFRVNARKLYGCRGLLSGSRASNTGIHLHWDRGWPGEVWTPGAPWLAHWFYDYYQYTGDRKFLRDHALPWMKDCALFYEDFLKGTEDAAGHYTFRPSFSAENGWADNATQDISICRELLRNLIAACETLGTDRDGVARWKAMLAKLPPYLINDEGQLKEWATPGKPENNNHRHLMHLYGAFESDEFSEAADSRLFQSARVALANRFQFSRETSTHGYMHTGLSATELGLGNDAYARLEIMATGRSMYPSLLTSHEPGPRILCDDGNGAIPHLVTRMIVQSQPGQLRLLPALPDALPQGTLNGVRARGQLGVDRVTWDTPARRLTVVLTSDIRQEIDLFLPPGRNVDTVTVDGKPQTVWAQGANSRFCKLALPQGQPVTIKAKFHSVRP